MVDYQLFCWWIIIYSVGGLSIILFADLPVFASQLFAKPRFPGQVGSQGLVATLSLLFSLTHSHTYYQMDHNQFFELNRLNKSHNYVFNFTMAKWLSKSIIHFFCIWLNVLNCYYSIIMVIFSMFAMIMMKTLPWLQCCKGSVQPPSLLQGNINF